MQSSSRNCFPARLRTSSHSRNESWSGPAGTRPTSLFVGSVAVDKGERAEACLRPALPSAPQQQSHGRPDPTRQHEPGPEGRCRRDRNLAPQLGIDVGRLAETRAEIVDGAGETLALVLDVPAYLLGSASVMPGH